MNLLYKEYKSNKEKKNFFFLFFFWEGGGVKWGAEKVNFSLTKNPNLN